MERVNEILARCLLAETFLRNAGPYLGGVEFGVADVAVSCSFTLSARDWHGLICGI